MRKNSRGVRFFEPINLQEIPEESIHGEHMQQNQKYLGRIEKGKKDLCVDDRFQPIGESPKFEKSHKNLEKKVA